MKLKVVSLASAIALSQFASSVSANESELRAEIEALKSQIDSLADAFDSQAVSANEVSIGGYAELHLNVNNGADNEIDFHRFVLYFNKEFNSRTRLFTELELEHSLAGDGKPGEVELEQAYIQYDLSDKTQINAGLFMVPVGILNETHEPDTFYGVERNGVEKSIIPTTWWEGGVALVGKLADGLSYDVAVHSGLDMTTTDNAGNVTLTAVRSGRQKVAEAVANDPAVTARIKYTAIPGLELAATVQHQQDVAQGQVDGQVEGTLVETHAIYQSGGFGLKALYAAWDFDDRLAESSEQDGFYVEPSYRINNVGVFARVSELDTAAADGIDSVVKQQDVGVNYWLTDTVVFKADYFDQDKAGSKKHGYNLGVGYSF